MTATPWPGWTETRERLPQVIVGLVVMGVGIAAMVRSDLGLGPWDVLHQGISDRTGIPIGTVSILVGAAVMLAWLPLRERPGPGTFLNLVLVGLVTDAVLAVTEDPSAIVVRAVLSASGPVLMGVGTALYIGAGLGSGPRDGVMTAIARRGHPVGAVRTGIELAALAAGFALGGTVGIGTIWQAVAIGPIIHVVLPRVTRTDEAPDTAYEVE